MIMFKTFFIKYLQSSYLGKKSKKEVADLNITVYQIGLSTAQNFLPHSIRVYITHTLRYTGNIVQYKTNHTLDHQTSFNVFEIIKQCLM
jgi:hypothetical protein